MDKSKYEAIETGGAAPPVYVSREVLPGPGYSPREINRERLRKLAGQNALLHRLLQMRTMGVMNDSDMLEFGFGELTARLEAMTATATDALKRAPMPVMVIGDGTTVDVARIARQDEARRWRRWLFLVSMLAGVGWTSFALLALR